MDFRSLDADWDAAARRYLFGRRAAVLGSSNVSTPKTRELYLISPALKPAAPENGARGRRTPPNRYARRPCQPQRYHYQLLQALTTLRLRLMIK